MKACLYGIASTLLWHLNRATGWRVGAVSRLTHITWERSAFGPLYR